ncbi:MAG TPA: hypothetical protein DDX39_03965 [Bacteroidales bacterium]|nr:MAG: hypothetical protein A2W98_09125 [Bacteroidetes bacterium GWF2_33_38]OFY88057.1 MAG: hypothetical protein A2236_07830 [Bacteroidetes bacterium RIFOXYA2_FULL_33_7]HBF87777.1 hypothetical protein [Bacteroidales bacterium]
MRKNITLLLSLIIFITGLKADDEIHYNDSLYHKIVTDSLFNIFNNAENDTIKINLLNDEIGIIYESINIDSALFFYEKAIKIADKHLKKSPFENNVNLTDFISKNEHKKKSFSNEIKTYANLKAQSLMYIGLIFQDRGNFSYAIEKILFCLNIYKLTDNKQGLIACNGNLGNIFTIQGNYPKAIEYYLNSLKISDELLSIAKEDYEIKQLKQSMSYCYIGIGNIHIEQKNYTTTIEYFKKSLEIALELDDKSGIALSYNNIGNVYNENNNSDLAINFYLKALAIQIEINDKNSIATCYGNIGTIYKDKGDKLQSSDSHTDSIYKYYNLALDYFQKSFSTFEELENKNGTAYTLVSIASLHNALSEYLEGEKEKKHLILALENGTKAFNIAKEINSLPIEIKAAYELKTIYINLKDYEKAIKFSEIYIALKDSLFKEEKTNAIAKAEMQFESEKKQNEIKLLNKEKELKEIEISKQKTTKNYLIGIVLLIIIFSIGIIIAYRNKRKNNILLKFQNIEISERNEEIRQQKEAISLQSEMLENTNKILERKNIQIIDSINYAKQIQDSILPSEAVINEVFGESFIYFKPKDIVSGDFYWFTEIENQKFIAVVDCTGHGIPGAFMSMIGNTLLNEIVNQKKIFDLDKILLEMHEGILYSMSQKSKETTNNDGMEISICKIKDDKLEITSTNQNVILITNNNVIEIEGGLYSIGSFFKVDLTSFPIKTFDIQAPLLIYLFSDGFHDQFGGPNNKKFSYNQLRDLLIENQSSTLTEQVNVLEKALNDWIGDGEQIDDITILGIKI